MDGNRREQIKEIAKLGKKISESGMGSSSKGKGADILEKEEQFRKFFQKMPDAVIILDRKGTLLEASEMADKLSGYTKGELIGKNIISGLGLLDAKTKILCFRKLALNFSGHEIPPFEIDIHTKDGRVVPLEINPRIINYMGKKVDLITLRDITERKMAERLLKESQERYKIIFEGATTGIVAVDPETKKFVFANPRICEITGYSSDELLKTGVYGIHPKGNLPHLLDQFEKLLQGKITVALGIPVLRKDKKIVYCDINTKLLKIGEKEMLVEFFTDVTERRKSEEELKKLNEELKSKVEELEKINKLAVGRELRMIELKKRIEELEGKK